MSVDDLGLPVGLHRSGRARYAAAMTLYQAGGLSDAALEVYRICALLDRQDPAALLPDGLIAGAATNAEAAIRALVGAADDYLATLPGPGVAEVRAGLNRWRGGAVTVRSGGIAVLSAHIAAALAALTGTQPALARAIAAALPHLNWITYDGYPVQDIGAAFATGHCYASIIGEDAAIAAQDFDLGLFLIAPHVLYRDHHHAAPELYAPLTGPHGWRFGPDRPLIIKEAHQPVWNAPHRPHLTKVGPVPFLALFGWTRDVGEVAQVLPAQDWAELEALRLG